MKKRKLKEKEQITITGGASGSTERPLVRSFDHSKLK